MATTSRSVERYVVRPLGAVYAVWDRLFDQWADDESFYHRGDAEEAREEHRRRTQAAGLRVAWEVEE